MWSPPVFDAPIKELSGGNIQKAILARVLHEEPVLLIAAQPTRGVDVGAIEYIHQEIIRLRDQGNGVLLISAELDEIIGLSDRILVMFEGSIVGELAGAEASEARPWPAHDRGLPSAACGGGPLKNPVSMVDHGVVLTLGRQIVLIALALVLASIVLYLMDYDPFAIVKGTYRSIVQDFGDTIRWTTPLILAGLAAAAAFRAGVWNLGIDGQLYFAAATAAIIGLVASDLTFPFSIIAAMVAGIFAGALWALFAAILRVLWGASEVVTTLLLNFVAFEITDYLVLKPFKGTGIAAGTMFDEPTP